MSNTSTWDFPTVNQHMTMWFPAPEWAHQLIEAVMNAWIEYLWDTAACFLIPWVFQCDWGWVSKHIVDLCLLPPLTILDYDSDIPCVLVHLPCYVCSLPSPK